MDTKTIEPDEIGNEIKEGKTTISVVVEELVVAIYRKKTDFGLHPKSGNGSQLQRQADQRRKTHS